MKSNAACSWLTRCRAVAAMVLALGVILVSGQGGAGHSVGHFPSYYPDEIRIDAIEPQAAADQLADNTLHAYLGTAPKPTQPLPAHVKSVKSLGSLLVVSFDTRSSRFASAGDRCAAALSLLAALRTENGFVFHPYPITPYHADHLHHLDRIETAKRAAGAEKPASTPLPVAAQGELAESIVRARFGTVARDADVVLAAVPVDDLLSDASVQLNGWSSPPWLKQGWFHAYRLLAAGLDAAHRPAADKAYEALRRLYRHSGCPPQGWCADPMADSAATA